MHGNVSFLPQYVDRALDEALAAGAGVSLARTGVQNIQLLDYQLFEELNLDRTLNVHVEDIGRPRSSRSCPVHSIPDVTRTRVFVTH